MKILTAIKSRNTGSKSSKFPSWNGYAEIEHCQHLQLFSFQHFSPSKNSPGISTLVPKAASYLDGAPSSSRTLPCPSSNFSPLSVPDCHHHPQQTSSFQALNQNLSTVPAFSDVFLYSENQKVLSITIPTTNEFQ